MWTCVRPFYLRVSLSNPINLGLEKVRPSQHITCWNLLDWPHGIIEIHISMREPEDVSLWLNIQVDRNIYTKVGLISSRKSYINYRPQTFSIFNGEPKEPERAWSRYFIKETYTYPKPSHAKSALVMLVTTRPYVCIIGKAPQITIDIKMERSALILNISDVLPLFF